MVPLQIPYIGERGFYVKAASQGSIRELVFITKYS